MEPKEAVAILKSLLDKYPLDDEEKEAVLTAIGVLGWVSLSKSRMKMQKAKKEKAGEW